MAERVPCSTVEPSLLPCSTTLLELALPYFLTQRSSLRSRSLREFGLGMGTPSRKFTPCASSSSTRRTATASGSAAPCSPRQPAFPHPLEDDTAVLLRLSRSRMEDEEESPTSAVSDDEEDGEHETAARRRNSVDREESAVSGGPPRMPPLMSASWASSFRQSAPSSRQSAPSSPSHGLESLRQDPVPPLPDEQDRKRFIGCLAAVLASSCDCYSYGKQGGGNSSGEYDDGGFSGGGGNDVGGGVDHSSAWTEHLSRTESRAFSCDDEDDDDDDDETDGDGGYPASDFDRDESRCSRRRVLGDGSPNSSFDAEPQALRAKKAPASALRHRQRWYSICSKLLLSSAEMLQIDKGQARGFLPMLSKILVPNRIPTARQLTVSNASNHHPSSQLQQSRLDALHKASGNNVREEPPIATDGDLLMQEQLDRIEHIRPFLESMTPGAGFRCLSFFLLQHLMNSPDGYDARVRRSVKVLAVLLLVREMEHDPVDYLAELEEPNHRWGNGAGAVDRLVIATRKFEALEQHLATKLLQLSQQHRPRGEQGVRRLPRSSASFFTGSKSGVSREQILRGLKIGGTAVVAGTLFAVTGGLAAPGIAAGVAAIAGGTAAAAAATAVLTSTAAVTAIFGVGGGGLAAYKMQRRTKGLTEFEFHKESEAASADLFLTVAISGWLRDECDFQRPWGVCPSNPPLRDRLELLERFYFVYSPDHVPKCRGILQSWEGEEDELWKTLSMKYGRDPSSLFPLHGPRTFYKLTLEQEEVVDKIFAELGYVARESPPTHGHSSVSVGGIRTFLNNRDTHLSSRLDPTVLVHGTPTDKLADERLTSFQRGSLHGPITSMRHGAPLSAVSQSGNAVNDPGSILDSKDETGENPPAILKHLSTVWDYGACYGGELYTVKWEGKFCQGFFS
jgi:Protein of unknown function (DUF726)